VSTLPLAEEWQVAGSGGQNQKPTLDPTRMSEVPTLPATPATPATRAARALLEALKTRGLQVQRRGGALHVTPRRLLTDTDRAALREHKPALLQLLAEGASAPRPAAEEEAPGAPARCPRCLRVLPRGQSECAGPCDLPAVVSVRDYPPPALWTGTLEAWRAGEGALWARGFAKTVGRAPQGRRMTTCAAGCSRLAPGRRGVLSVLPLAGGR